MFWACEVCIIMCLHTTITLVKIVLVKCLSFFTWRIMSGFFRKVRQELVSISSSCGGWKMHFHFLQFSIKKDREREILQISEGQNLKTWTMKKRCFHRPCNMKKSPILRDACLWKCHSSCLPRVKCEQFAELETLKSHVNIRMVQILRGPRWQYISIHCKKHLDTSFFFLYFSFFLSSLPLEELKCMWHWCEFPPGPTSHLNW